MHRDSMMRPMDFSSSFLSCQKDLNTILKKLFVQSKPYSEQLIRLMVINTKDCLDNKQSQVYKDVLNRTTLATLRNNGYIRLQPKLRFKQHEQVKSYILVTMDNFVTNPTNPEFRDCTVTFDIFCHPDYWDLGDYRIRPLKIAGYIDGILNKARLSGIGIFQFLGCNEIVLDESIAGYSITYRAVHWTEDKDQKKSESELFKR